MHVLSLSRFVDFLLKTGPARATDVRAQKQPPFDFYQDFKAALAEGCRRGEPFTALELLLTQLGDPKKKRLYPPLVKGLRKFLAPGVTLIPPPPVVEYPIAPGFAVRVNPELAVRIDGNTLVLKLHLRTERLTTKRTQLLIAIMQEALWAKAPPGAGFGVLDVGRAKLHGCGQDVVLARAVEVIRADGLAFAALWGRR